MVVYAKAIEAVVSGLTVCIIIPLLIHAIISFRKAAKFTTFMWIFTLTGISYLGYNILKFYTSIATEAMFTNPSMCQCYWQSYSFYLIGKYLMYLFYCNRVYDTFKNSMYELKPQHYKILFISVSIFYLGITFGFILESAQWGNTDLYPLPDTTGGAIDQWEDCVYIDDHNILYPQFIVKIILLFVGEIIFAVILLRLYVRKVLLVTNLSSEFRVEVSMNSVHSVSISNASTVANASQTSATVDDNSLNSSSISADFLEVAVKSTNLVIFSVVTSLIAATLFDALGRWLLEVDTLVNFLCMYCTFRFAKSLYKYICYGFNKCCWVVCVQSCFICFVKDCCQCKCQCFGNREEAEENAKQMTDLGVYGDTK